MVWFNASLPSVVQEAACDASALVDFALSAFWVIETLICFIAALVSLMESASVLELILKLSAVVFNCNDALATDVTAVFISYMIN